MTTAMFDPTSGTIRADLTPDAGPVEVHAGHEGHSVIVRLTPSEARRLVDQLSHAIRRAEHAKH